MNNVISGRQIQRELVNDLVPELAELVESWGENPEDKISVLGISFSSVEDFVPTLAQFHDGKHLVSGNEMLKIAEQMPNCCTVRHADLMMRCQNKIPEDFRQYNLVFPEIRHASFGPALLYLCWNPYLQQWEDQVVHKDYYLNSSFRIVLFAKPA